ncbi:SDR family oxidoreductase [Streptodolium elevatio]
MGRGPHRTTHRTSGPRKAVRESCAATAEAAARLTAAGADVHHGSLDDLDDLRKAAASADGVVHLAFKHDIAFSGDHPGAVAADHRAIEALGDGLAGSDRPLVIASGIIGLGDGRVLTERDGTADAPAAEETNARLANAHLTRALAARGARSSVVRLAPTVHGAGDYGFVPALIGIARDKGVSGYVDDGANRWPAVHRLDAARLFRLAVESAPVGATLHGVADEGVPARTIAEVIGRRLGIPVVAVPRAEADEHFGWIAGVFASDIPTSNALTRELLGWEPTQIGFVEDLDRHYFDTPAA